VKRNNNDETALETLGATVRTTLDPKLQEWAQTALQNGVRAVDKRHSIGRAIRNYKGDKLDAELAKITKALPKGGPVPKEIYPALVTEVSDDDKEIAVDLGGWQGAVMLGGDDDARFNQADDKGEVKKPSERFKVGDLVEVMLPPSVAAKPDADDDDEQREAAGGGDAAGSAGGAGSGAPRGINSKPAKKVAVAQPKHAKHRVAFGAAPRVRSSSSTSMTRKVRALVGGYASKVAGFNRATMAPPPARQLVQAVRLHDRDRQRQVHARADRRRRARGVPQVAAVEAEELRDRQVRGPGPAALRAVALDQHGVVADRRRRHARCDRRDGAQDGHRERLKPDMSIALGSNEARPLEITNAYVTLRDRRHQRPTRCSSTRSTARPRRRRRASRCCGPRSRMW